MSDNSSDLARPPRHIAELAADPEGPRWARDCAWVPGTGHCRNRPCGEACLFRDQRLAEADRVTSGRRKRRPEQQPNTDRPAAGTPELLLTRRFSGLVA